MDETLEIDATIKGGLYKVAKLLGKSEFSNIYILKDTKNNKPFLMKELLFLGEDEKYEAYKEHFTGVVRELSTLSHPNLPKLIDYFFQDKKFYYIREFIEGTTIDAIVKERKSFFAEAQLKNWFTQVFNLFLYLHSQNPPVYFGLLKPTNLILTPMGRIRIIDFGLDRFFPAETRNDILKKTAHGYTPPEFSVSTLTGEKSDIYVIGAILYYIVTGKTPEKNLDFLPIINNQEINIDTDDWNQTKQKNEVIKTLELIKKFEPSIRKALSENPDERFGSIADFKAEILGESGDSTESPEMMTSVKKIEIIQARPNEEINGKIDILNTGGGKLTGRVWSDVNWMSLDAMIFDGNDIQLGYSIKTRGMNLGVVHNGNIVLNTRNSKRTIPVRVVIEPTGINIPLPLVLLLLISFPLAYSYFVTQFLYSSIIMGMKYLNSNSMDFIRQLSLQPNAFRMDTSPMNQFRFALFLIPFYPWSNAFLSFFFFTKMTKRAKRAFMPFFVLALLIPLIWFVSMIYLHWPLLSVTHAKLFAKFATLQAINLTNHISSFFLIGCLSVFYYLMRFNKGVSRYYLVNPTLEYIFTLFIIFLYLAYFVFVLSFSTIIKI